MLTILLLFACTDPKIDADTALTGDSDPTGLPGDDVDPTETGTPGVPARIPVCGSPPPGTATPPDFSTEVLPIFQARCQSCHRNHPTGLTFKPAYDQLVDAPSAQLPGMVRVAPEDLQGSYLWHKICGTHLEVGGSGSAMPGAPLSDADATRIAEWIVTGALP